MDEHLKRLIHQVLQKQEHDSALISHIHRDIIAMALRMEHIMSKISEFATAMQAFTDRQDAAVTALQGDVKSLEDQIAALQASAGTITPEDQVLLDGIQAHASTIADKLDALDALTPPVVPPTT